MAQRIVDPWTLAEPSVAEVRAIKALAAGEATPDQQKTALKWIIHKAAGASLDTFIGGQPDIAAYRQGRRAVGLMIVNTITAKVEDARREGETDV